MGYSCVAIPEPRAKTGKAVDGLEGVTVWLIAGEGKSPKSFFLAANFVADTCQTDLYPGTDLPNQISGIGSLFGKTLPMNGSPLLSILRKCTATFIGFTELRNREAIAGLDRLAKCSAP